MCCILREKPGFVNVLRFGFLLGQPYRKFLFCVFCFHKGTLCDVRRLASEFSWMKEAVCMKIYDIVVLVIMILSLIIQVLSFLLK